MTGVSGKSSLKSESISVDFPIPVSPLNINRGGREIKGEREKNRRIEIKRERERNRRIEIKGNK